MRAKTINEIKHFERGLDPKKAMGTGVPNKEQWEILNKAGVSKVQDINFATPYFEVLFAFIQTRNEKEYANAIVYLQKKLKTDFIEETEVCSERAKVTAINLYEDRLEIDAKMHLPYSAGPFIMSMDLLSVEKHGVLFENKALVHLQYIGYNQFDKYFEFNLTTDTMKKIIDVAEEEEIKSYRWERDK